MCHVNSVKSSVKWSSKIYIMSFLGWTIEPCERQILGPHLLGMEKLDNLSALDYLLHFLPLSYISNTIIPATNHQAKKRS